MLKRFLPPILCGVVFVGKIHAQEVIVAREKKSEVPTPTVQSSEQISSETPTPAPRKSRSAEKKSAPARITLEEMRAAGGRAAGGSNDRSVSQSKKNRESDVDSVQPPTPVAVETPEPVKKETPMEQRKSSRSSKPASTNLEGLGPIRPTMMESGREASSPSPSGR
jgi:hypothetical protein